ncbi:hypothetical protein [Streptomyces sp. NPDC091371]|uniref:hypothetical protein n=1 Tax=Streptomyces sp. NPDC091371 TaxID=3155303 RepID=UPI00341E1863
MTFPDAVEGFEPTHVVPQDGLPAWESPDATRPTVPLDPFLPVQLLTRRGDWGEVLCSNGWSAWVDGRLLVAVPQPPPTADGKPPARGDDPRPLLARSTQTVERYRRAVEELASGRTDAEAFRRTVRGLRAGIVLDGESVWLYDETAGRWLYGDGSHLSTYAVAAGPGAAPDADTDPVGVQLDVLPDGADVPPAGPVGHAPTQVVDEPGAG